MSAEFWFGVVIGAIGWQAFGERFIIWLASRIHDLDTE